MENTKLCETEWRAVPLTGTLSKRHRYAQGLERPRVCPRVGTLQTVIMIIIATRSPALTEHLPLVKHCAKCLLLGNCCTSTMTSWGRSCFVSQMRKLRHIVVKWTVASVSGEAEICAQAVWPRSLCSREIGWQRSGSRESVCCAPWPLRLLKGHLGGGSLS